MTTRTPARIVKATIAYDPCPENPREDWDPLGTFVGFEHRHYNIGDRRPTSDELTALEYGGWAGLERHLSRQHGAILVLPVGMIDHSGVSYYIGGGAHPHDPGGWDSGTCGFIYSAGEGGADLRACLTGEIETYSQWASGDVTYFTITARTLCELCERADDLPDDCPHCEDEVIDSCGGFYGSDPRENGMIDQAGSEYREALIDAYHAGITIG